jgi:hypothetical protein
MAYPASLQPIWSATVLMIAAFLVETICHCDGFGLAMAYKESSLYGIIFTTWT